MCTLLAGGDVAAVRQLEGVRAILFAGIGFTLITESLGFKAVDLLGRQNQCLGEKGRWPIGSLYV